MSHTIEFFFDYVSPTAYLAQFQVKRITERTGAELVYRPMFLGGVMHATGNKPPGTVAAKGKYMSTDLLRTANHLGIPFHFNPAFPMNTRGLTRATLALEEAPDTHQRFMAACWTYLWGIEHPLDLSRPEHIATMCEAEGFNTDEILAYGNDMELKAKLAANTKEAVARGAFGAPTFFVDDEMFFGGDRLDYVERALKAKPS